MSTQLVVRNVDDEIAHELKRQAAENHRSAEAQHREILRNALSRPKARSFKDVLAELPNVGEDADFEFR